MKSRYSYCFEFNTGQILITIFTGLVLMITLSCSERDFEIDNRNDDLTILSQILSSKYGKIGISDAANEGIDEFYFLAPTVSKSPKFQGRFHPNLAPVVEISDDFEFERFHKVFSTVDPENVVSVDQRNEQYVVNWDLSKTKAEKGKIYRVRVRIGERVMGYMDVAIVSKGINKLEGGLTPLEENQSMKIHFRLEEKDCPSYIRVTPISSTIFVGQNQQFIAKVYNFYNEQLDDIDVNWSINNEAIASIDNNGIAIAISVGYTKIYAKSFDVTGEADLFIGDDNGLEYGTFTDIRDGQVYKTKQIGEQIWMAQNLNFQTDNSYCYGNNPVNCEIYGRLYKWEAVKNVCPQGWVLPNDEDWEELGEYLGGRFFAAGGKMKSIERWVTPNVGATNESGFSALPSGRRYYDDFWGIGLFTLFWSSSETMLELEGLFGGYALMEYLPYLELSYFAVSIDPSFSCRCIKDN